MSLITKSDLENRASVSEINRWARNDDAIVASAIAQAESKARSAALNVFTAESWDAMTADQLPGEALYHLVSDAIDILSAGSARATEVETKAAEAKMWRSWLAAGTVQAFTGVLTRISSSSGGVHARVGAATNVFDNSPCSELRFRSRRL